MATSWILPIKAYIMAGWSPAAYAAYLKGERLNNNVAIHFAIAMGGIMGLFIIHYWLSVLLHRGRSKNDGGKSIAWPLSRGMRSILLRRLPVFTSVGHFLLFAIYIGINFFLIFYNLDSSQLTNLSRRMGWMTSLNLALIVVLALKNTPLAILTPYSYERLNILHQLAGYTTITCVCIHAITFLYKWVGSEDNWLLNLQAQIFGMVAGGCMLMTLFVATVVRVFSYELFYVIHVVMFLVIIIALGLHRPDITAATLKITLFTAGIWFLDRVARFVRISYHAIGCSVTTTPLPLDAVKLQFSTGTSLWRAQPGSHVFLWIPGVRAFEMHPFTLVSTDPLELVIASQDGFTRDLRKKAIESPKSILRASVDGPYGSVPNWDLYNRVLLIAGGSGASFCIGVALGLVRKAANIGGRQQKITLIWVIRSHECLTWFSREMDELSASPYVTIRIYVTRAAPSSPSPSLRAAQVMSPAATLVPTHNKSNSLPTNRPPPKMVKAPPPAHTKSASWSSTNPSTPYVTVLSPTPPSHSQSASVSSIARPSTRPKVEILRSKNTLSHESQSYSSPISPTSTLAEEESKDSTPSAPSPAQSNNDTRLISPDSTLIPIDTPSPNKHLTGSSAYSRPALSSVASSSLDLEKSLATSAAVDEMDVAHIGTTLDVRSGRRPNLNASIREFVVRGGSELGRRETWEKVRGREISSWNGEGDAREKRGVESVMVAACGPGEMMGEVRKAVVGVLAKGEREVEVEMHLETFGW